MAKILFVMTGSDHWTLTDGTEHPTGFWAEEALAPYAAFTAAGYEVVVATPGGVVPPVDQTSLTPEFNGGPGGAERVARALAEFTELQRPIPLATADPAEYAAVFYPGGHGPMEDLADDKDSGALLSRTLAAGIPLGVVCHGVAALLAAGGTDGDSPFAGYRLTGFSKAEEMQTGLAERAPWLLQDRLTEIGADYVAGAPWVPHVVVDRTLITGQNPASSAPIAQAMLDALG
jgi:putative intracellular protease/amidase